MQRFTLRQQSSCGIGTNVSEHCSTPRTAASPADVADIGGPVAQNQAIRSRPRPRASF